MWLAMAVAKGKSTRGCSFPHSKSVLGGNRHETHHQLHQTLLGAPAESSDQEKGEGTVSHAITFLNNMVVRTPTLDAWDQFVWPPSAAIPRTAMQAEQYGYHHRNAVNLGAVMPAMKFRVTNEEGTYLCAACGLVFEGSILAYDPAKDKVEWVPACGVANNLSWVEERMAVALANFVPHAGQEADPIAELRTRHLAWTDESSLEEEGEEMQEEDGMHEQMQEGNDERIPPPLLEDNECKKVEGWGESNPKVPPGNKTCRWGKAKPEMELQRRSQEWASIMEDEQPLTFDDLWSDSDHSTLCLTPLEPGLLEDVVEVHVPDSELQAL